MSTFGSTRFRIGDGHQARRSNCAGGVGAIVVRPTEASEATAPDAVLDAVRAVMGRQMLQGTAAARGVGEEGLVAQVPVRVEQGELGAGVRTFAAHDDPGVLQAAVQLDHAGQLGDLRTVTQGAVLFQRGGPAW
ncbi:hypothetical protein [Streptomyces griseomycini]|uniref:Uncharacterized protein n=1 Tax=Streptomyces griseomycini TaxID=66895 RepID=A0A7W7PRY8_9ACTN|nr:hypothetical protein [Streptomyces griseomycini]MBB4899208.1 hypothetical protein [Streptomyces griseomycini]GGR20508.1 hypothetical protein GCM10015536_27560 [Streptomyces griseomycini]